MDAPSNVLHVRTPASSELSEEERSVVDALLSEEARHPERPRPILVLTPTDPWLPPDTRIERPKDISNEEWQRLGEQFEVPLQLRQANRSAYDLTGVVLPAGVRLYARERFEGENRSQHRFHALVGRLGGVEPLVLAVSRPVIVGDTALIVEHVHATWSGCGGINLFEAKRTGGTWHTSLKSVLAMW